MRIGLQHSGGMSIRKRKWKAADGSEKEAWVVDYTDQQGKRRLKTFAKKKDADAFQTTMRPEVRAGTHVADNATCTFKEAGERWLESGKSAGLERTTLDQYRQHLTLHIDPFLGRLKLSHLSVPGVRAFQDQLRDQGRSPAMIKRVTVSLGSLLADAQERGLVTRNPVREMAKGRARGKVRQGERRQKPRLQVGVHIPTREEIRRIIDSLPVRWRPFFLTAIFTGLRASELRGIRWSDVDLSSAKLHVRQRADRYHVIGMPKSDAGQRTVPLPPVVVNALREWKLACPQSEADLVFPNGAGKVEYHVNIIERGLKPALVAAGVVNENGKAKYPGLHALRHFYASWCINPKSAGGLELSPKVVQQRMGHSSITMTMDVYGHLFPSTDDSEEMARAERDLLSAVGAT
jgi:integrase